MKKLSPLISQLLRCDVFRQTESLVYQQSEIWESEEFLHAFFGLAGELVEFLEESQHNQLLETCFGFLGCEVGPVVNNSLRVIDKMVQKGLSIEPFTERIIYVCFNLLNPHVWPTSFTASSLLSNITIQNAEVVVRLLGTTLAPG